MTSEKTVDYLIREHLPNMPLAEKKLAHFILNFPGNISSYSALELSAKAGTSQAAATRFCKRLGYKNYKEIKLAIREGQKLGSPLANKWQSLPDSDMKKVVQKHLITEGKNLKRTLQNLPIKDIEVFTKSFFKAKKIHIVGFRNSYNIALYLHRQLILMHDNISLLPVPGQTLAEECSKFRYGDILIAVGMQRRTPNLITILEIANQQNLQVLLISDPSAVTTKNLSTWQFICHVGTENAFDNYSSVFSTLNLLLGYMQQKESEKIKKRIKDTEILHQQLRELRIIQRKL